jgi:tetratricopeptide (TPR) repeat protein
LKSINVPSNFPAPEPFGSGLMVDYLKALRLAQADLDLKKSTLDLQDVDLLMSTCHVGAVLACTGHFRESAELLEALMNDMPENAHYQTFLYAASSLGGSYNRLEEYQASFDLCTNAMARFESVFAGEGPETVALYNVMGETLCGLGRPKECLIWATKAVLDAQKVWGPTHPKTCKAMAYLARVYECLRDFRNAVKWREKCIICLKACLGPNHPETIYAEGGLIDIFTLQRRNFWSRKTIIGRRRALFDKTTEQLGENDWQTLAFQEQLAKAYFGCGWFKKAKCVQEKWVEVMTQNFGPDDKRTMRGMAELARTNQWIAARKAMYWWLPQNFYEKLFAACGDVP